MGLECGKQGRASLSQRMLTRTCERGRSASVMRTLSSSSTDISLHVTSRKETSRALCRHKSIPQMTRWAVGETSKLWSTCRQALIAPKNQRDMKTSLVSFQRTGQSTVQAIFTASTQGMIHTCRSIPILPYCLEISSLPNPLRLRQQASFNSLSPLQTPEQILPSAVGPPFRPPSFFIEAR